MTAQQAINSAVKFLIEIYGDEGARRIRVEELELDEQDPVWHVTLSYYPPSDTEGLSETLQSVLAPERVYKTLEVFSDGQVRSMKIRALQ